VRRRQLAERAVTAHDGQSVLACLCVGGKAVGGEGVSNGVQGRTHGTVGITGVHLGGQFPPVMLTNVFCHLRRHVSGKQLQGLGEQAYDEVMLAGPKLQIHRFGRCPVPFRRPSAAFLPHRCARSRRFADHVEVPTGCEFVQVVAGYVGVKGYFGGCFSRRDPMLGLPGQQVDTTTGRVAKHRRGRGDGRIEFVDRWRSWRRNFCLATPTWRLPETDRRACVQLHPQPGHESISHPPSVERMPISGTALETAIVEALRNVQEPEIRRGLVDLDMVRSVEVDGTHAKVVIACKTEDDPVAPALAELVRVATANAGASRGDVHVTWMTDDEKSLLRARLTADDVAHENAGAGGHGHAAGPTRAPKFMQTGAKTRVLGMTSGKGGVGKSSTTVNVAIALAQRGLSVGILDADVYGFSIPKMMGIEQVPTIVDGLIIPPVRHGVAAMSIGFMVEEDRAIIWRGPMLHKALEQFLVDVYWGEPDFLLIDMPPGTGDVALSMAQYLPRSEVYVVTTPQPAAQRVAQRSASMARTPQINMKVHGIIENMSWFTGDDGKRYEIFGAGGGADLAATLDVPLIGQVPLMPELRAGMDIGEPITVSDPTCEASVAYASIAKKIHEDLGSKRRYNSALKLG
jgi:ATP-binding protein involved in chromosome partitioning